MTRQPQGPRGIRRNGWDDIKVDLRDIGCECEDCMELARDNVE